MTTSEFLDLFAIAERLGLAYTSVRSYHINAEVRRHRGTSKPGDFPPPDNRFGRTPVWSSDTIDAWHANRPGRGVGGGRPRKQATEESDEP